MPPEQWVWGIIVAGLVLYALFGGADFGAGVWELLLDLRGDAGASQRERKLLAHAIGPVWEANHVWLIFVLVGLLLTWRLLALTIHNSTLP